ncbi:heparinase II/III family protein [Corynebacterium sp. LK2510]|uniref:heparinase II/III domain-containing protein n=1 Tax=Corynebacterium sp. LK2510 TaxID=3110472 RepID=UPI0034CEAE81
MSYDAPPEIQSFLPQLNPERSAESVRTFLGSNRISLDVGVFEDFDAKSFFSVERDRSSGRKAHAWFFLREWTCARDHLELDQIRGILESFSVIYPYWREASAHPGSMAFHDETTAQRLINATYFFRVYEEVMAPSLRGLLERRIAEDISFLESDQFHAGLNNHGMFQDIALLVAFSLGFASADAESKAVGRLVKYFDMCFTPDGIHVENNPTYHVMVSRYLSQTAKYLRATNRSEHLRHVTQVLSKADTFAAFCTLPNGEFPPVSDTRVSLNKAGTARRVFGEGAFLGAVTRGKAGKLPARTEFIAAESGYAVFRSGWSSTDRVAFFSAAYNNDFHKHSDELSLYIFDHGRAIFAEAGPNGYQYNDPLTAYAFSSFAHNTLLVDGNGLPRIDRKAHLTTMTSVGEQKVEGRTRRFDGVDWKRTVDASKWAECGHISIHDSVNSSENHTYTFLWHLGPEVVPIVRGNFIEVFAEDRRTKIAELSVGGSAIAGVRHVRGQMKPNVQGFAFPAMGKAVEASAIEIDVKGSSANLVWELRTKGFLMRERGITPASSKWKTFAGEKVVRYLVDWDDQSTPPERLLVVFSAVTAKYDFTYNYRASLLNFPGAVAYIIDDFGDQGSYYAANGRNFAEFRSVQGALNHIVSNLGLSMDRVMTLGSSKGGSGAILHGVAAGVSHVFAGAPQYKIGSFTSKPHPSILRYLAGGTSEADVAWADGIMRSVLESGERSTPISIVVGKRDGHFRHHVIPLVDEAEALGYPIRLLGLPGTTHAELGGVFRRFVDSIGASLTEGTAVLPHACAVSPADKLFGVAVDAPRESDIFGRLFRNGEAHGPLQRAKDGILEWKLEESGLYRARVYVDQHDGQGRRAFGTPAQRF